MCWKKVTQHSTRSWDVCLHYGLLRVFTRIWEDRLFLLLFRPIGYKAIRAMQRGLMCISTFSDISLQQAWYFQMIIRQAVCNIWPGLLLSSPRLEVEPSSICLLFFCRCISAFAPRIVFFYTILLFICHNYVSNLWDPCQIKHIGLITVTYLYDTSVQQYALILRHVISLKVLRVKWSGLGETARRFLSFFSPLLLKSFESGQGKETQCISC